MKENFQLKYDLVAQSFAPVFLLLYDTDVKQIAAPVQNN